MVAPSLFLRVTRKTPSESSHTSSTTPASVIHSSLPVAVTRLYFISGTSRYSSTERLFTELCPSTLRSPETAPPALSSFFSSSPGRPSTSSNGWICLLVPIARFSTSPETLSVESGSGRSTTNCILSNSLSISGSADCNSLIRTPLIANLLFLL